MPHDASGRHRRLFSSAFSYKVDYEEEIANDEAEIALLEGPLTVAASAMLDAAIAEVARPDFQGPSYAWWYFVAYKPEGLAERLSTFGLTEDDWRAWNDPRSGVDSARKTAIDSRLGEVAGYTSVAYAKRLKLAKARLQRHRRNQKKFGEA